MRALFITLAPMALAWFGMEVRKWWMRRQEAEELRERNRRRSLP